MFFCLLQHVGWCVCVSVNTLIPIIPLHLHNCSHTGSHQTALGSMWLTNRVPITSQLVKLDTRRLRLPAGGLQSPGDSLVNPPFDTPDSSQGVTETTHTHTSSHIREGEAYSAGEDGDLSCYCLVSPNMTLTHAQIWAHCATVHRQNASAPPRDHTKSASPLNFPWQHHNTRSLRQQTARM